MAKTKLKAALDNFKGVDHKLEHQKRLQKKAEKRKRSKLDNEEEDAILEGAVAGALEEAALPKADRKQAKRTKTAKEEAVVPDVESAEADDSEDEEMSEGWETADEEGVAEEFDLGRLEDSDTSDSEIGDGTNGLDDDSDDEDEEDIPLSDIESLASEDRGDILPHQRLTINNTSALNRAHKSIALPTSLSFSANQTLTTDAPVEIADVEDDLNRELAFYKQSLDAVTQARALLKKEGASFSRPADYFAEMVKSDEHMGKIKQKLVDEAASKKASSEARRQRDLKKFGKQVQVAKLQERDRAKRDTMDKINLLKRKRQGADIGNATEESMFDVALEDVADTEKADRAERRAKAGPGGRGGRGDGRGGRGGAKPRAKRDEKYGFGGKKRFGKSNDAESSADTRSFSVKRMKDGRGGGRGGRGGGRGGRGGGAQRPGKSRRANNF